jgi:long-chain acyl-CoA synthetase
VPGPARQSATSTTTAYADRPWLGSYPAGVPADFDFPKVPLTRLLDDAASSFPTGTALAFLGSTLTYRELKDAVDRFATALKGLGVGKGDRVAIVLPNCPQNVIAFFATLRLGAVVVQHNPLYTQAELRHQLADCGATVAICLDKVWANVEKVRPDTALQHVVVTSIVDYLPASARLKLKLPIAKAKKARAEVSAPIPKGAPVKQFLALLKTTEPARQVQVDPEQDLALLQYTGGTTGLSKGAILTHDNLVSNAYMNRLWDTDAQAGKEVTLAVLPLFHAYGLTVAMNATILLGGTLVLLPRFDLDLVFAAIDEWKPTMFPGVPPIYKALSDSPKAKSHDLRDEAAAGDPGAVRADLRWPAGRGLRHDRDLAVDALQPGLRAAQAGHHRRPAARHALQDRRAGRPVGRGPCGRAGRAHDLRAAGLPRLLGPRRPHRRLHRRRLRADR